MLRVVLTGILLVAVVALATFAAQAAAPFLVAQDDAIQVPQNPPPATATERPAIDPADVVEKLEGRPYKTGLADAPTAFVTFKTPFEQVIVVMTVATLAVTLAALIFMGWRNGMTPEFTQAFIVVVVVFAALFLIAAGYSDKQAAPVYGLLGTIVGYIFGKLNKQDEKPVAQQEQPINNDKDKAQPTVDEVPEKAT